MYDIKRNISGEMPEHMEFIRKAKKVFKSWGYPVVILRGNTDYLDHFHHVIKRAPRNPEHEGLRYGFPLSRQCSIKRDCKLRPMQKYLRGLPRPVIQYIGMAADEPKRLASMAKNKDCLSLLSKYGYTEEMARDLCVSYDLLSPAYAFSTRQGCFFCPWSKLAEHEHLRASHPELWQEFLRLESETGLAFDRYNPYLSETLADREQILAERRLGT